MVIQQIANGELRELALFAGAGGGILGGKLLGWRTVCAVERDAYASQVLAQRQNDGILEPFPIWSDVCSFDGTAWRGIVDVVSGGFPCQDISAAGKGAGIEGERSGMWKEMARIIGEVRPKYAFVENSPMLTTRGLGTVLADLASLGFDAEWGVLSAADVGAPHRRERIWIIARQRDFFSHTEHNGNGWGKQLTQGTEKENGKHTKRKLAYPNLCRHQNGQAEINTANARFDAQCESCSSGSNVANTRCEHGCERNSTRLATNTQEWTNSTVHNQSSGERFNHVSDTSSIGQSRQRQPIQSICSEANRDWQANIIKSIGKREQWEAEPQLGRVANGVAYSMDRLKAIGNGQVPLCAATAFELLRERLEA